MSKIHENKQKKEEKLLEAAFSLFISKGINETTIQDIVDEAGVAKGTFYLYFKDKYEITDTIISIKTENLLSDAIHYSHQVECQGFTDRFLIVIDYIINHLAANRELLKFIYKNLSAGMESIYTKNDQKKNVAKLIFEMFMQRTKEENLNLKNPEVTFFMIIELVGATCYSSILFNNPLPFDEYKPYLYDAIKKLLK